ncbi:MAG: MazG nucleotide pyrophosphohydrolase domain-containing protein [Thermoplasmatota archaeon]
MELRGFQNEIRDVYFAKDQRRGLDGSFLWLAEEVGELSEALRRKDFFAAQEEIADVVAWTASVANLLGIDLEQAIRAKYPRGQCGRCHRAPCACPS